MKGDIWKKYPFLILAGITAVVILIFATMPESMLESSQNLLFIIFLAIIFSYSYFWQKRKKEETEMLLKRKRN
ncbi:MAG: hypothetical protein PVG65_07275 [Candidatus Thorarchaeota archaeon]